LRLFSFPLLLLSLLLLLLLLFQLWLLLPLLFKVSFVFRSLFEAIALLVIKEDVLWVNYLIEQLFPAWIISKTADLGYHSNAVSLTDKSNFRVTLFFFFFCLLLCLTLIHFYS
jgi:hypothetical protein